tara:strand:- start:741 stop:1130 length:390 start_codon:yes stop_codon:yes gene_type:complete
MQNINAEHCLENDSVETIDVVTKTKKVESCTNLTVYKIVENAKRILDDLVLEQDPTCSRYFIMYANIYRDLVALYYTDVVDEYYCAVDKVLDVCVKHLEYVDDAGVFTELLTGTALADRCVDDYTYLSN